MTDLVIDNSTDLISFKNELKFSLDKYISELQGVKFLTKEEETALAIKYQKDNDLNAAKALIVSHLRLVVTIARNYKGYGLPQEDLIQEGNIGLMKAVKAFDPTKGFRLTTFAMMWIKSEIGEYIIKNWRIVKIATTHAQRKLFFRLRAFKKDPLKTLTIDDVEKMSKSLKVKPEEIREMELRFFSHDFDYSQSRSEEDDDSPMGMALDRALSIDYLEKSSPTPDMVLEQKQTDNNLWSALDVAMENLDDRKRRIIQTRYMLEDGQEKMGLKELAEEFNVSAERIRQLEVTALKELKQNIEKATKG